MYQATLKNGEIFSISEKEYAAIAQNINTPKAKVFLQSLKVIIDVEMIAVIKPQELKTKYDWEKRQKMTEGYLHTGERAVKQFGIWYDPSGERNESGKLLTMYDSEYYPEVARDCIATLDEWQELKQLPRKERLAKMLEGGKPARLTGGNGEFQPLKQVLDEKK